MIAILAFLAAILAAAPITPNRPLPVTTAPVERTPARPCRASEAREDSLEWVSLGPSGGPATILAVHPTEQNLLVAGNNLNVFRSTDGGEQWCPSAEVVSLGLLYFVAWDPNRIDTIYLVGRTGLFRCNVDGSHCEAMRVGVPEDPITTLTVVRGTGACYAGTERGLFKSTDGGTRWRHVWSRPARSSMLCITALPGSPSTLFAGAGHSIFRSTDDAVSWVEVYRGTSDITEIVPRGPRVLFAWTDAGTLLRSADGGTRWQRVPTSIAEPSAFASGPGASGALYVGSALENLQVSTDAGDHWRPVRAVPSPPPRWPTLKTLRVNPHDPRTLYGGTPDGLFKSVDGGSTWKPANVGLNLTRLFHLALDPTGARTLLTNSSAIIRLRDAGGGGAWEPADPVGEVPAGFINGLVSAASHPPSYYVAAQGLFRSRDEGRHWTALGNGLLKSKGRLHVDALGVDPTSPSTLYAQADTAHFVSDCVLMTYRCFKSIDGGDSCTPANEGLENGEMNALVVDPVDPQTVYGGMRDGVFKSTNGGVSWSRLNMSNMETPMFVRAAVATHPSAVFLSNPVGLFASRDEGVSWQPSGAGLPARSFVTCIVGDPQRPLRLYAGMDQGVYASLDGGATWRPIHGGLRPVGVLALAVDPLSGNVFAATPAGVYVLRPIAR